MTGVIRVGISGWTYGPWRGVFYPKGLRREDELVYVANHFKAVEINDTFYGLQYPEIFAAWADQVPADFAFCVRAPRHITHVLRLRNAEASVASFIASGLLRLGIHLGPILWQLPANLGFDPRLMEHFLGLLPHDTAAAAALGQRHDKTLRAPAWLEVDLVRPMRHAFSVRHKSFLCSAFTDLLRAHGVALVCADAAGWPGPMDVTSDFVYCRLQSPSRYAVGGYDTGTLDKWARRVNVWAAGHEPAESVRIGAKSRIRQRDVFVLFDTDKRERAPGDALELIRRLR